MGFFATKFFIHFVGYYVGYYVGLFGPKIGRFSAPIQAKIWNRKFFNFFPKFFLKNWCIECFEKARNRPEARYKKARPARGPIHKSPSPPEARKTQARNITST